MIIARVILCRRVVPRPSIKDPIFGTANVPIGLLL